MEENRRHLLGDIQLSIVAIIWGLGFVAAKIGIQVLSLALPIEPDKIYQCRSIVMPFCQGSTGLLYEIVFQEQYCFCPVVCPDFGIDSAEVILYGPLGKVQLACNLPAGQAYHQRSSDIGFPF